MNLLRQLFGSKKFIAMVCGLIGIIALKVFKLTVDPTTVAEVVGLVASYIVGQGISDAGKGAAQATAIAAVNSNAALAPADQVEAIKSV